VSVSNPPTAEELAELAQAMPEGRRFIIVHLYAQLQKNGWRNMSSRGSATMARNLESRVVRLEAQQARPNEILIVWRKPDGDVSEALKGTTFARDDRVICAEWFDDSPPPAPRWYSGQLRITMERHDYEQINRTLDRIAECSTPRDAEFAPFPSFAEDRIKEMTDEELLHAILGVRT
jgi:hypothetical protein